MKKTTIDTIKHWQVFRTLTENEPITETMKQALFAFDNFIQSLEDDK